ncbi:sensor histidine kinase [Clostridium sp. B9]
MKKQNVIYLLFRTIKSRNNSIIYLIIFSVILDFIVSFNVIIHDKDNPLFKQLVLILLFTFLIFITIYFWNIDKKSKEIDALNLALKDNIDLLKKVKHDYGAQISYLYGLHLMKKYDRLGELLKNIIDGHNSVPSEIVVSNTDSILTDIVNSIDLKGINVFIDENADFSETSINELDLQRIISNIVKNSVTALGDHGLGLISITTFYSLNQLVIKIKNNGPKIEPEVLEKIFDTGFTTKKNQNKNNGFGLSIVKELVESYDGRVFVNSDNISTEFTINIPINK